MKKIKAVGLLLGRFTPKCEEDGTYKKKQCHSSAGYCWCVDVTGVKLLGTEKPEGHGQGKVDCDIPPPGILTGPFIPASQHFIHSFIIFFRYAF